MMSFRMSYQPIFVKFNGHNLVLRMIHNGVHMVWFYLAPNRYFQNGDFVLSIKFDLEPELWDDITKAGVHTYNIILLNIIDS